MRNTVLGVNAGRAIVRPVDGEAIAAAGAALRAGHLVAFPTETVYGLGADAGNPRAVARIFAAKRRPRFNPLIVHAANREQANACGVFDAAALALAEAFWPGPLTLVVPRRPGAPIAEIATAGLDTVALRVPGASVARAIIDAAGVAVAAPSANLSGRASATTAAHVAADLGAEVAMVIDAGPARHGIESTIVAVLPGDVPRLLRPGAVTREAVEAVLGSPLAAPEAGVVRAPGQLASHYAPNARLRLEASDQRPGEAFVAFGPPPPGIEPTLSLSDAGDLVEAAARLFGVLRRLDELGVAQAAVMPVPTHGLGEAINDRLARAAAPRDDR